MQTFLNVVQYLPGQRKHAFCVENLPAAPKLRFGTKYGAGCAGNPDGKNQPGSA